MMRRGRNILLAVVLLFLYAPIAVLVLYSFNDARFSVGWNGFTLAWYTRVLTSSETLAALRNTLIVSGISTLISTVLGTMLAVGLYRHRFRGRRALELLLFLPVIVPDIIIGASLLALFVAIGLPLGRGSIILAHVAFQISFVALVVGARLQEFPHALMEAARDLGAGEWEAVRAVLLPLAAPGIAAGALLAFALSIDDFVITYFTAGAGASTLPIRIYSMVKRGVTPDINALSTMMLLVTVVVIVGALHLQRRSIDGKRR